jgi:hypothetical protein
MFKFAVLAASTAAMSMEEINDRVEMWKYTWNVKELRGLEKHTDNL